MPSKFPIGMKVCFPENRTRSDGAFSVVIGRAKSRKQYFLYLVAYISARNLYVLNHNNHDGAGDYFYESQIVPYTSELCDKYNAVFR